MIAQEAFDTLLREIGEPMAPKALAHLALQRGLVRSDARKPIDSIAQTVEKNVREEVYNEPPLKFVSGRKGERLLALPEWEGNPPVGQVSRRPSTVADLSARVPVDLLEQVQLAVQARIASGFGDTVTLLLRRGLAAEATNIRDGLMKQLKHLGDQ